MEIFCALFPRLALTESAVDAAIADFQVLQTLTRAATCSSCAGDYEDPDRTAPAPEDEPNGRLGPVEKPADRHDTED